MKHEDIPSLLGSVQRHALGWFASLDDRPVTRRRRPGVTAMLGGPIPDEGIAAEVLTPILAKPA